eukprot:TRINITY_DN7986_c0_g1_i1.p1 TRINITY_DN7986_c0_g1~~TRINITY_DN7986_c0_g1_i1.p1  ORF type:complete len:509 (-),score=104.61 TRINITY_DN7986_c0_g1_i1:282-1808(-)
MNDGESEDNPAFLSNCFLIMDRMIQNERATEEDIVLFFHPEDINLRTKIHTITTTSCMTDFSSSFSKSSVLVVELRKYKLAYKEVGEFIMVLSGGVKDSNHALVHHMDLIWDCLQFYAGSFERIVSKGHKDRRSLQKIFRKYGKLLIPLIQNFHSSPMKFSSVPYIQLSEPYLNTSTHFVISWQLLSAITEVDQLKGHVYGCSVIYHSSVVCTQLDVSTTRWIANLCQVIEPEIQLTSSQEIDQQFYTVFIRTDKLRESLIQPDEETKGLIDEDSDSESSSASSSASPLNNFIRNEDNDNDNDSPTGSNNNNNNRRAHVTVSGRTRCGLYLLSFAGGFTIGILLTWQSYQNDQMRKKLLKVVQSNIQYVDKLIPILERVTRPVKRNEGMSDISDYDENHDEVDEGLIDKKKLYNYFNLDDLTDLHTGRTGIVDTEANATFSLSINWAHDLFCERPESSKLVLRNHTGNFYCKKLFGKETFYHDTSDRFDEFEDTAAQRLKDYHSIHFV